MLAVENPPSDREKRWDWLNRRISRVQVIRHSVDKELHTNVALREVPARRVAAVRYSGVWSEQRYDRYLAELEAWLRKQQLTAAGGPIWARYEPPFMPWFMRRNEILIPVSGGPPAAR